MRILNWHIISADEHQRLTTNVRFWMRRCKDKEEEVVMLNKTIASLNHENDVLANQNKDLRKRVASRKQGEKE